MNLESMDISYESRTRKVVISRNVVFNEHAMLQDSTTDFPIDGQQKSSV